MAARLNMVDKMEEALDELKKAMETLPNKNLININQAKLSAKRGDMDFAEIQIMQLHNYPDNARKSLIKDIDRIYR